MALEKITEELLKETKEPEIVEHRKTDLENERASVVADKERFVKTADERIAKIDEMLALFSPIIPK